MENYNMVGDLEQNNNSLIMEELRQGRELARRLQLHLTNLPCSSQETREMLVQKIVSSYEKVLSMLMNSNTSTSVVPGGADHQQPAVGAAAAQPTHGAGLGVESPPLSGEDSDRDQELKDGSKKRKATKRSTHLVRVNPATGLEGSLDDGFSWRKYGQKDILGAKHPRGYYRCTHRLVQGCLATKQVQRSDEDPMILEITYRGRHTCTQASKITNNPPENQEPTNMTTSLLENSQQALLQHGSGSGSSYQQQQQQQQHPEALLNLRRSLQVVTDQEPDHHHQNQVFSPATFTGSSSGNYFSPVAPNNNFMSPATSGTANNKYFSNASPSGIITTTFQGGSSSNQNFQSSDHQSQQPELMINVSSAASAANSPTVEVDFPFGNNAAHEFAQHDSIFDNLGFFSQFHPFEK